MLISVIKIRTKKTQTVRLFDNILKAGTRFLLTPLVNWKMEDI